MSPRTASGRAAPGLRGAQVEEAACRYLTGQGLQVLARNARYRVGELDLVMHDGACVVFVEVRYREAESHGSGAATVNAAKRRKLERAAQCWLLEHASIHATLCRFDVVEVSGPIDTLHFHWIADAFRVGE